MNSRFALAGCLAAWFFAVGVVGAGRATAQEIRRGVVKRLDVERRTIVITHGDRDWEMRLPDDLRVLDADGRTLAERLANFKPGSDLFFQATLEEPPRLKAVKLAGPDDERRRRAGVAGGAPGRRVSPDHAELKPLDALGAGMYHGYQGGFYPDGKNVRPESHEAAGRKLAAQVRPLDETGAPHADGKIVLLSVGMSNTSQSSQGFAAALAGEPRKNPRLVFVNGAQGGMTAVAIQNPDDGGRGTQYWRVVDERLRQAGVGRRQVQAIWIKQADAGPSQRFPRYAETLQAELTRIVQLFPERFPNARLVYLSSRTYGGYATTSLNPEPYAYESGFAVKWLVERQIAGEPELNYDAGRGAVRAPWLSWGAYLWANGDSPRSDGFRYVAEDFQQDGTHQSASGQRKVGRLLLDFFLNDATTRPWFVASER